MLKTEFIKKLRSTPKPVVVDFWALCCGPCKAIEPTIEKFRQQYSDQVAVWKVNTDQELELLRSLRIYGIPNMIAFQDGQEVMRHTGAASSKALQPLFDAALSGNTTTQVYQTLFQRFFRIGVGLAIIILAVLNDLSGVYLFLAGSGALLMFSGVYDRCPIYRMVLTRFKEMIKRDPSRV